MRKIDLIVYHCSATEAGRDISLKEITRWHRARGFKTVGYHFLIHPDGRIDTGRKLDEIGAHSRGYNFNSVGVCYIGGILNGEPWDTRTVAQIHTLRALDSVLKSIYPGTGSVGHRDLSADLNGDGAISKNEWMKSCPSFDVKTQL